MLNNKRRRQNVTIDYTEACTALVLTPKLATNHLTKKVEVQNYGIINNSQEAHLYCVRGKKLRQVTLDTILLQT